MPDIITHYLFGIDVLKDININYKPIIEEYKVLYFVGCQGPDPFLYNHFTPFLKEKSGPKIGSLMHKEKTGDFIKAILKELKFKNKNSSDFKELFSYFAGFITHFALDSNAHPYIFHVTGVYDKNNSDTYKYRGKHKSFEMATDTILLKEKLNLESKNYKVHKKILIPETMPRSIVSAFEKTLYSVYGISNGGKLFDNSYKDIKRFWKYSSDPYGIKKKVAKLVDKTINKTGKTVYSTLSYYNCVIENIDYLNKNKNTWTHPCYEDEKYRLSFYDMMENGIKTSLNLLNKSIDYLNDKIDYKEIDKLFKNISYSTGKPWADKTPMKYFNCIICK